MTKKHRQDATTELGDKIMNNLVIHHDKHDQMWYVYDKTDDNHEYIFDYFSDVSLWVKEYYLQAKPPVAQD